MIGALALLVALQLSAPTVPAPPPRAVPSPLPSMTAPSTLPPATSASRQATGQAPIVAGNQVGARERALDDALRQLLDQALGEIVEPSVKAASEKALRVIYARPRTYVRRYRVIEQGETAGIWRMQIEGDVDVSLLRRDAERALLAAGVSPSPALAPEVPLYVGGSVDGAPVLSAAGSAADGSAVSAALAGVGVRTRVPKPSEKAGGAAVAISIRAKSEGTLRGVGKVSFACTIESKGGPPGAAAMADARGFAATEQAARADCVGRAAADLAAKIGSALSTTPASAGAQGRAITIDADVIEPSALAALLKLLRSLGSVSSAELRSVSTGQAEIRVTTLKPAAAISAALARDAVSAFTLTDLRVTGDLIQFKARALPAPSPSSSELR